MIRKSTGPNGTAIIRNSPHISDAQLTDRAMQVGHLDVGSIAIRRDELAKAYAVRHNYTLSDENVDDVAFAIGEDAADQHSLVPFEGIAFNRNQRKIVFFFDRPYHVTGYTEKNEIYRAIRETLKSAGRI